MSDEQRTPRNKTSREETARPSDAWVPQGVLPVPEPQDGWVFRWIRTSARGQADNTNVSKKFREGWRPVKGADHPELRIMSDLDSRFAAEDGIEVGGLLLCKAPAEMIEQRNRYYRDFAARQIESVDRSYRRENDPRMPLLEPERRTEVKPFGKGG